MSVDDPWKVLAEGFGPYIAILVALLVGVGGLIAWVLF